VHIWKTWQTVSANPCSNERKKAESEQFTSLRLWDSGASPLDMHRKCLFMIHLKIRSVDAFVMVCSVQLVMSCTSDHAGLEVQLAIGNATMDCDYAIA
jgi:hypothetical protein